MKHDNHATPRVRNGGDGGRARKRVLAKERGRHVFISQIQRDHGGGGGGGVRGWVWGERVGGAEPPLPPARPKTPPAKASQQWSTISNGFIEDYLRAQP